MRASSIVSLCLVSIHGHGTELVINGSFENDGLVFGGVLTGWGDGTDEGAATLEYPSGDCGDQWCSGTGGFIIPGAPATGVSGPDGRERFYAFAFGRGVETGGRIEFEGFAAQHVSLSKYASKSFEFGAWLASRTGDGDFALVTMEFFSGPDATGDGLGSILFDGNDQQSVFIVGSANTQGLPDVAIPASQDNWTFYRASGVVPTLAASAAIRIEGRSVNATGFVNDGYVDLVSLQVIPEPSTAVMLIGLFPILLTFSGGRYKLPPDLD
jgi:hypothetical protein